MAAVIVQYYIYIIVLNLKQKREKLKKRELLIVINAYTVKAKRPTLRLLGYKVLY